jgi:Heavy-metal resistance
MTETTTSSQPSRWLPQLRSRWWTAVLGLSLMANLLVIGLAGGALFRGGADGRIQGASYVQLVPRSFFRDISKDRRSVLMQIVRGHRDDLREMRKASDAASLKLADVLEREPFVLDDVRKTVTDFTTGTESLAAKGGDIVMQIVTELTPEERKQLAAAIRERDQRSRKK